MTRDVDPSFATPDRPINGDVSDASNLVAPYRASMVSRMTSASCVSTIGNWLRAMAVVCIGLYASRIPSPGRYVRWTTYRNHKTELHSLSSRFSPFLGSLYPKYRDGRYHLAGAL